MTLALCSTLACVTSNCSVLLLTDPFAEDTTSASKKGADTKDYVHVRVQQRNGKKSLTTVQGLPQTFDYKKILKALKKGKQRRDATPHQRLVLHIF